MNIAQFSVKNPVLVNLLMIGLFIGGFMSLMKMPAELNPEVSFNWVFITVTYPGAAPEETESLIVDPIETEIQDVDNIDEIQSTAGEGFGFVMVKFEDISESTFRERLTDLKSEIDKVELPEEAEDPSVDTFSSGDFLPVITINMAYQIPEDNAQAIADDLKEDLEDIAGVAKIQVSGLPDREIWVEVLPEKMNAFGLTFQDIVFALKKRNINIPGGTISFGKTEYLIRSIGEYQNLDQIRNTIIRLTANGSYIRIKDVARVDDRREEMSILSRMNGVNSITFSISKKQEASSIEVIDQIKALVRSYEKKVPRGVDFSLTNDNSIYIMRIINILRNNALTGMVLIFFVLYFFLGRSNALLASLGIPISFFIAFILMYLFGYTLNGNSLFALVMVLGIIVDDAIIVLENAHRYRLKGYSSAEAAVIGTKEVAAPIISSIATNIAAFLPLMLLPGIMGKFMRLVPLVFSLALIASLFEAFFLLPSHYADWTVRSTVYKKGEKKFFKRLRRWYGRVLIAVLRKRYIFILILIIILVFSPVMIGLIGVEMFGEEDFDQFKVLIKMPEGTSLQETNRIIHKFEQKAAELPREDITAVIANVGLLQGNEEWVTRKNVAQILFQLKPVEERRHSTAQLLNLMREKTRYISGPTTVEFEQLPGGPPVGKPISVKVQGKYLPEIKKAALALQDSIRTIPGAYDISDDFPPGKQEIRIIVDEEKAALYGFTIQTVAMNVRSAFDGITATEYRDGDEEVDVVIKYSQENRAHLNDILFLKLNSPSGEIVALRNMVHFEIKPGPTEIHRFDRQRTILVTGNINEEETKLDQANLKLQTFFPLLEKKFPGIHFEIGGQFEEFMNVFADITLLFVMAILLIFLILGTQFRSYSQPLVILTTVPFALLGAVLGLFISGNPFSIVALFGIVALAGIVVNDAIVLIDFINKRREGKNTTRIQRWRAIVNAGRLRLRPIILTSLTTIFGLLPMAVGFGGQSEMWSPLANVILFGLLVSTILTLFLIPSLVAVLDDLKGIRFRRHKKVSV